MSSITFLYLSNHATNVKQVHKKNFVWKLTIVKLEITLPSYCFVIHTYSEKSLEWAETDNNKN